MNEVFDGIQKIYQVDLPLSHGEEFELEVINKDKDSVSIKINDGGIFAMRLPRALKVSVIGQRYRMQYFEYKSAGKIYAKIKKLQMLKY